MNRQELSVWGWHKNKTILYWFFSLRIVLLTQFWNTGRAVNTIDRKQSKTWERGSDPGLVDVRDSQHSWTPPSDSSGFSTLPATRRPFFSSWKCTFSSRSHIYSFLKRFLLVVGLLSVWGASWVLWSMASWKLPCSLPNWSWNTERGPVWDWEDPQHSTVKSLLLSSQSPKVCHWKVCTGFRENIQVLCTLTHILGGPEGN